MIQEELEEISRQCDELNRLSRAIKSKKSEILSHFPQVLCMTSRNKGGDFWIEIEVSEQSDELQQALQNYFGADEVRLRDPFVEPAKWSLYRLLYEKDVSDVLDQIGYRAGLYRSIQVDEEGAFLDMRLSNDTEETRAVLREAYPDIRIKFSPNDKKLTFSIAPS